LKKGFAFKVTCTADASPPANYTFYQPGKTPFLSKDGFYSTTATSDLYENITCLPVNKYGGGPSKTLIIPRQGRYVEYETRAIYNFTWTYDPICHISIRIYLLFYSEYQPINTYITASKLWLRKGFVFNVTCTADASPPANYTFYQHGKTPYQSTDGFYSTTSTGDLYESITCLPVNKYGRGPNKTITIPILGKYVEYVELC